MDIEVIKKLIKDHATYHTEFIAKASIGRRYYEGDTDILYKKDTEEEKDNPLRNADNRIPTNWHGLLVDQKAAYMLTYPPTFDTGDKNTNKTITESLGDEFPKVCKDLCVEASNTSIGWLHCWKDDNSKFQYAVVPSEQIIPLFSSSLKRELIAVLRVYDSVNDEGKVITIYEYWTDAECYAYEKESGKTVDESLRERYMFQNYIVDTQTTELSNNYKHDFGEVPFIPFYNNNIGTGDLKKVKKFIDVYDKVFSGFVNDLEDIQEIIFVLTNYGGTNLKTFLQELKEHKVVDMQSDGADEKTGLDTITINIPVEAREKVLTICEKQIYKQGQGVDPNPESFGNSSGVALEYLYSLLELKAGLTETEFRLGFAKLIRMLCKAIGANAGNIIQTWTRNKIRNDSETAEIASKSKGVISDETIVKNHPWVDNPEEEIKKLKEQNQAELPFQDKVLINEGDSSEE